MRQEIMIATRWIAENCLLTKDGISTEILERFEGMIQKLLEEKYKGHWYETEPYRGQAFRALSADEHCIDKTIALAAEKSGLAPVDKIFRKKWMLWVDPGEVEVKDEITNQRIVLYRKDKQQQFMNSNNSNNYSNANSNPSRTGRSMSPPRGMNPNSKQFIPSNQLFGLLGPNYNPNNSYQNNQKTILRRPNNNGRHNAYHDVHNDLDVNVDYHDYRMPSPRDTPVSSQA